MSVATGSVPATRLSPRGRRAVFGAWFGFFVDLFDIYLPVIALAPANAYFAATGVSATTSAIIDASVFAATLVGRPLGALLFGHFADRIGRRRISVLSVVGFSVVTLLIAALPGYRQIGIAAVVLLIALRFLDGLFLGGEYTAATPLAMEYSPKYRRGFVGGIISTGFPVAYCAISLLTLGMLQIVPAGDLDSPYVRWGWRVLFVIGAAVSLAFALWYAKRVPESEAWQRAEKKARTPVKELLTGQSGRNFAQVFVLMTGMWLTSYMLTAVLPKLLASPVGLGSTRITAILVVANAVVAFWYLGSGIASQRIGRRTTLMVGGAASAVLAPFGYALVVSGRVGSFPLLLVLVVLVTVLMSTQWGCITTYLNERFSVGVRASGYGLGYSLGMVVPAFYAFYQAGLESLVPARYTAVVLLALGGVLTVIGASLGPDTRENDLAA
ncbi:MFS transporter [Actinocatenispora rupis]|uniref:MFS transporter n=1 Tax=Actinocatenispora rupis TaxID=519421 RepID=A0A8J3IUS8_9ACTN|nr:MFS transporter [Actinocatenispora rupis]GID09143.1 MFS transporter [Actinocatenispora rupis]